MGIEKKQVSIVRLMFDATRPLRAVPELIVEAEAPRCSLTKIVLKILHLMTNRNVDARHLQF